MNKFTNLYLTSGGEHLNPQNSHHTEGVLLFLLCQIQIFLISSPLLSSVTFWAVSACTSPHLRRWDLSLLMPLTILCLLHHDIEQIDMAHIFSLYLSLFY